MFISWYLARRYFQSYRHTGFLSFIATFTIIGITLGTAALIITLAILAGFEKEIKEKVIGFTSHIQVQGFAGKKLNNYEQSVRLIRDSISEVVNITPFIMQEALIRFKDKVDGIFLKGMDLEGEGFVIKRYLVEGDFFAQTNFGPPHLVIGKKLADRLGIHLGDEIFIFGIPQGIAENFQPRVMKFKVGGIYESGMTEYDDFFAFTNLKETQTLFQLGNSISGIDIRIEHIEKIEQVAIQIQNLLGYPHQARTVFQLYRNLFSWIELQKKLSPILLWLIIIVATVNLIGTLLMYIIEKVKSIGIIRSLGASKFVIQKMYILQGIMLSLIGIIFGNALALILSLIQEQYKLFKIPSDVYFMSAVPIAIKFEHYIIVSIIAFILSFITTLLPSRSAANINIIEAIRFE